MKTVKGRKRGRFQLDVCPKCEGLWFDKGEITKISGNREIERKIVEYAGGQSNLVCPRCGQGLVIRPVGDFILDVCTDCKGVWLDSGELEKAIRKLGAEFSRVITERSSIARHALTAGELFSSSSYVVNILMHPRVTRIYPPDKL